MSMVQKCQQAGIQRVRRMEDSCGGNLQKKQPTSTQQVNYLSTLSRGAGSANYQPHKEQTRKQESIQASQDSLQVGCSKLYRAQAKLNNLPSYLPPSTLQKSKFNSLVENSLGILSAPCLRERNREALRTPSHHHFLAPGSLLCSEKARRLVPIFVLLLIIIIIGEQIAAATQIKLRGGMLPRVRPIVP